MLKARADALTGRVYTCERRPPPHALGSLVARMIGSHRPRHYFSSTFCANVVTLNHDRLVLGHTRGLFKTQPCQAIRTGTNWPIARLHVKLWVNKSFWKIHVSARSRLHTTASPATPSSQPQHGHSTGSGSGSGQP